MAREFEPLSYVPKYSSWYIALPSIMFITAIGLIVSGSLVVNGEIMASSVYELIPAVYDNVVILGAATFAFSIYHLVAERYATAYYYYAILIPAAILWLWFGGSSMTLLAFLRLAFLIKIENCARLRSLWKEERSYGDNRIPKEDHAKSCRNKHSLPHWQPIDSAVLVLCVVGWIISLITVVLMAIVIAKHRKDGGKSRPPRRTMEDSIENGAGSSEDVSMERMGGSRNNFDDVDIAPSDENTDASDNFETSENRAPVHHVSGHLLNPLPMNLVINTTQNRASVHCVPGHPYHPLRMNPVDAMGSIRPVVPETMEGSNVQTFETQERVPDIRKSSAPLVSAPLQSADSGSQAETMGNAEQIPNGYRSTALPVPKQLAPARCGC